MKNKVIFYNATFNGNLKALYYYIKKHYPNIEIIWFVDGITQLRNIPIEVPCVIRGERYGDQIFHEAIVVFEDKLHISYPISLSNTTPIINVWHGVGLKQVELNNPIDGLLAERVMKRYIQSSNVYKNQVYFISTSTTMTKHFQNSMILKPNHFFEFGMPRLDEKNRKVSQIIEKTKILWAPTFRDQVNFESILPLSKINKLLDTLKLTNQVLIFSPHPNMLKDPKYSEFARRVRNSNYIHIVKKQEDIYEYLENISYSILDYSSLFYDLVYLGFDKFIRYIPDFESYSVYQKEFRSHYFTDTYGLIVKSIDDLLEALTQPKLSDMVDVEKKDILLKKYFNKQSNCASENILKKIPELQPSSQPLQSGLYSYNAKDVSDVGVLQRQAEKHKVIILHFDPFEKILGCSGVDEYFIKSNESINNFYKRIFYVELRKYNYDFWQHEGSQQIADERIPRKFGIHTRQYLEDFNRIKKISLIQAFWPKRIGYFKDDRIFENALAHSNKITRLIIDWKLTLISILYAKRKL